MFSYLLKQLHETCVNSTINSHIPLTFHFSGFFYFCPEKYLKFQIQYIIPVHIIPFRPVLRTYYLAHPGSFVAQHALCFNVTIRLLKSGYIFGQDAFDITWTAISIHTRVFEMFEKNPW